MKETPYPLVQPLSELTHRPISWLWPGRLARGKLSVLDGDPEIGKSLITLDLCARLTTGRPFPDGSPGVEPSKVLIMNGEDGTEDTVVPRLRALGADLSRSFVFHKNFIEESGPFRLPTHTDFLDRAMELSGASYAVLDPVMAFLDSSVHASSDMSVRRALKPLAKISELHGCHIAMVRHLNKSGDWHSLYRGGGTIGVVAACRSAYLCARDPQNPGRAVLAEIKNNLSPRQPSLYYRVQAQGEGQPLLEWLGQGALGADELLVAAGVKPRSPGPGDKARDFLLTFLKDGPRCTLDIWQAAKEIGFSQRTLNRQSTQLEITSKTVWANNRALTYWLLPDQKLGTDIVPPKPDVPSLEPWLAPLREQFPIDPLERDP